MTNLELVKKAIEIATKYKTLYVMGCIGNPMTEANKNRYCTNHDYNKKPTRQKMIKSADADTFGFDCVCLIKAILWGWSGDKSKPYGGAKYASNGVPDIGADAMITKCKNISTDFSKIEVGEAVWSKGHIGVYIGDGLAVECTPSWDNKVQITACNCDKAGYNRRNWTKHGKLPYIEYVQETKPEEKPTSTTPTVKTYKKGDKVTLKNAPLYASASSTKAVGSKSGTFYIYDGIKTNGRYRITNKLANCGKKPMASYVTGFVKL